MRIRIDREGLSRALAIRGMTQAELAAIAGLTPATVSHASTGRLVDAATVRKLAIGLTRTAPVTGAEALVGSVRMRGRDPEDISSATPAAS